MTIIATTPIVPSSLPQRILAEAVVVEAVQGKDVAVVGDRAAQQHRLTPRVLAQAGKDDRVELSRRDRWHAFPGEMIPIQGRAACMAGSKFPWHGFNPACRPLSTLSDIVFWAEAFRLALPHAFIGVIIERACLPEACLHG